MLKKLLTSVFLLGLVLSVARPVLAVMGPTALAVDFIYVDVDNHNCGMVRNFSMPMANSGMNLTLAEGATLTTGAAGATTDTTTGLNSSEVLGTVNDSHFGPVAANLNAGFRPLAIAADFIYVDVYNKNKGMVSNFSMATANSGRNTTGKKATVTTGMATAGTTTDTTLNTIKNDIAVTKTVSGPFAVNFDMMGAVDIGSLSGPSGPLMNPILFWFMSHNPIAIALDVNLVDVDNKNFGFVNNNSFAYANTGGNISGKKSNVTTGEALATTETTTNLNSIDNKISISETGMIGPVAVNFAYVEDDSGCFNCFPMGGPLAIAVDANVVLVDNNNFGIVSNLSIANANTGGNITGNKSSVSTGKATASTTTGSNVNSISNDITVNNTSNGPIAANVVLGQNNPAGACVAGTDCYGTIGPVAVNVGTPGTAVAIDATVVSVDNDNKAVVTNTSIADANTGGNTTGCGPVPGPCSQTTVCGTTPAPATVTTGDATASTETTTTVNTSTTTFTINR